jgi:hypothetical protein
MKLCPTDMYLELTRDESGRLSMHKTTHFWGFILMSFWITKLVLMGNSTTGEITGAMAVFGSLFVVAGSASKFLDSYKGKPSA